MKPYDDLREQELRNGKNGDAVPAPRPFTVLLPGSIRSKKNSKKFGVIMRRGRRCRVILPSKAYSDWEEAVRDYVELFCRPKLITGDVAIEAAIYYKGGRPDLSGCFESIGDCLEGVIWENDRQIVSWDGSRLYHDKANPRTEVKILEL